jgi:predicted nucleotidyltransferase
MPNTTINDVQAEISSIKDMILQTIPVEQVYLFGSYAYGTPDKDSDIDIYVVMKDNSPYKELDAEVMIRKAVIDIKTMPMDILVSKKERFEYRRYAATFEREVANKGVLLYG